MKTSIYTVKMNLGNELSIELTIEAANKTQAIDKAHNHYGLMSRKNFTVTGKMSLKDYYGFEVR